MKRFRIFDWGNIALIVIGGVGLLFLILPILVLLIRSVIGRAWESVPDAGVTEAVLLSFFTTGVTLLLSAAFGTPLAYLLARRRFRLRRFVSVLVELPIVLPPAVAGLALLTAFGRRGAFGALLQSVDLELPFTTTAVILAQTFVAAPFYIRAAQIGFDSVPREIEEAARVDGAGGLTLFWWITLPLSSRALSAGLVLCWARALGEFGATVLFAGSRPGVTQTMPLLIYNFFERDIDAAIWTGVLLVGLALVALLLSQFLSRGKPINEA